MRRFRFHAIMVGVTLLLCGLLAYAIVPYGKNGSGHSVPADNVPAALLTGNVAQARISTALAAGGVPISGTVLTASTRVDVPSIGTSSGTQHALPSGTGDVVTTDASQTLTNKTISGASNTITNLPTTSLPSGAAMMFGIAAPFNETVTLSDALAANSGSNNFTNVTNPDVCRAPRVTFGAGWDGGNVTLNGTDCSGAALNGIVVVAVANATITSEYAFLTLTSATKATVGASAATAQIKHSNYLGLNTGGRQIPTDTATACTVLVNDVLDAPLTISSPASSSPSVFPSTTPNGSRNYKITCQLQ